ILTFGNKILKLLLQRPLEVDSPGGMKAIHRGDGIGEDGEMGIANLDPAVKPSSQGA
ncbi:hypothetical protein KI387_025070, partial [Taxus chinensis]